MALDFFKASTSRLTEQQSVQDFVVGMAGQDRSHIFICSAGSKGLAKHTNHSDSISDFNNAKVLSLVVAASL